MEDLTGTDLGPYSNLRLLGKGGMAAVYRAWSKSPEREVAIKVLPKQLFDDSEFSVRFDREAKILANLNHAHILQVFDTGHDKGYSYIVMPLMTGGTLTSLLSESGLPIGDAVRIAAQLAGALHHAHERGLVHRDLKPSNVLLDDEKNCLLSDFGIARNVQDQSPFTAKGAQLGTQGYMSPEQGFAKRVDRRSDIYALGIVLFQMLTGRLPFWHNDGFVLQEMNATNLPQSPRELNSNVSPDLANVVLKALEKDPTNRYQTAKLFQEALQSAWLKTGIKEAATTSRLSVAKSNHPSLLDRFRKSATAKWRKVSIGILAIALLVGTVLFASLLLQSGQKDASGESRAENAPTMGNLPASIAPVQAVAVATPTSVPTVVSATATVDLGTPTRTPTPTATPTSAPTPTLSPTIQTASAIVTPTTLVRSIVPTPLAKLVPPTLQSPVVGQVYGPGEIPRFIWLSAGALASNQFYRLTVNHSQGIDVRCTRETSIPARDYLSTLAPSSGVLTWSVSVVQTDQTVLEGAACEGSQVVAAGASASFKLTPAGTGGGGAEGIPTPKPIPTFQAQTSTPRP